MSTDCKRPPAKQRDWEEIIKEGGQHMCCPRCYPAGSLPHRCIGLCGEDVEITGALVSYVSRKRVPKLCGLCQFIVQERMPCRKCGHVVVFEEDL